MENSPNTCLLWFLKAPVRGGVKSRLAASIGEKHALELYRCFLKDLLEKITTLSFPATIFFTPENECSTLIELLGNGFPFVPQRGDDLGERLIAAFQETFDKGFKQVIIIGGDSPDLPQEIFHEASKVLMKNKVVIGPAHDGGYYLLGIKREAFHPSLFQGIHWGTETVLDETLAQCTRRGIIPHFLSMRQDIDVIDDLKQLIRQNKETPFRSSRTMSYAERLLSKV